MSAAQMLLEMPPPPASIVAPAKPRFGRAAAVIAEYAIHGVEQADGIAEEPVDWLWRGWIAAQSFVTFAGRPGEGKTTLAALLAVAAAAPPETPVTLLGAKVVPVAPDRFVALLLEENSRKSSVSQIDRAIEAWGLDRKFIWSRILCFSRAGAVGRHLAESELVRPRDPWAAIAHLAIEERSIGFLVIDSLARVFAGRQSNNEEDQVEVGDVVTELMERGEVTIVMIAHAKKTGGAAIDLEAFSGSTQRAALGDAMIAVEAKKLKGRTIASKVRLLKQREIDEDEWPLPRCFTIAKSEGRWSIADSGADVDDASKPARDRVLEFLLASGEKTKAEIREALGMSGATLEEALTALFATKAITKSKKPAGKRKREVDVITAKPVRKGFARPTLQRKAAS